MKRLLIMLITFLILNPEAYSQLSYPVDSIDPQLRAGAKAVIRSSQVSISIINDKLCRTRTKRVITLLNEKAEDYRIIEIPYDELRHISAIKACAYDESGKLIWILRPYDIFDMRDFNGPEILSDERKKVFEIPSYNYPYTIEYSFDLTQKNFFLSSAVYLQNDPEVSIEESGLQCSFPKESKFNYKSLNLNNPTDSVLSNKQLFLTWREENLPAARQRSYAPLLEKKMPVVYAVPTSFNLKGYKGSFDSWQSYGLWVGKLIEGRDILDKAYADEAIALAKNIPDRRNKVKTLYEYMQKNTRYFYIGFGIGGNQPMPANEVAKNGYGDCKALSNYMKALLKVVGIESYYTLVKSGDDQSIQPDFPSDQFDHIILCVPDNRDTIWLECTDQTSPFNYLGSFTCDRHVLAVTPEGGKLLRTPYYGKDVNVTSTFSDIMVYSSGDADVKLQFTKSGLMYDDLFGVSESKPDMRKFWLANQFGYAAFDLKSEAFSFDKNASVPTATAKFDIHIRDLAAKSSNLIFMSPSFISGLSYIWEDPSEIELTRSFQQNDSVRIEIPTGYTIEFLPETKSLSSKFGSYSSHVSSNGKFVYFTKKLSINKAYYPKETYPEFYDFITEIVTAERQMMVLKSKY